MKIVKPGIKETADKLYLDCAACGCGFIMSEDELDGMEKREGTMWLHYAVPCPCCKTIVDVVDGHIDECKAKCLELVQRGEITI